MSNPRVSFEFFPPKTPALQESLWHCVDRLAPLAPAFVSVTYGAGGSTRERTHDTVVRLVKQWRLPTAAHLTCVGASRAEVDAVARHYWAAGVRHIVALRGDPPEMGTAFAPHPDGYANAAELVAGLRRIADFEISVAAYPEKHPDSADEAADLDNLKRKLDAGADRAVTQFFFEAEMFLRFRDKAAAAGIDAPIVPGILPVTNFGQVARFAKTCGATVPGWLAAQFDGLDEDAETRALIAAAIAVDQCQKLAAAGVEQFHFYTLNRAQLAYAISHALGLRPRAEAVA